MSDPRPRIRVGLLSGRADFYGGGQISLLELAVALRDGPVDPVVILPGPGPLASALSETRIPWIPLALPPLRPLTVYRAPTALLRLVRETRDRRLDLLHSDGPRTALYAGLAARWSGGRHVWHLRASRGAPLLPDRLLSALCDGIYAVSRAAASRSAALRASTRVRVIPTGLPEIDFLDRRAARQALGLPEHVLVAGYVGRLEPAKGVDVAIRAMPFIRREVPEALLVLVGAADREEPAIRRLVREAGMQDAVFLAGARHRAARLLPAFDLLLHPSRHEALPRVLIETLFAGVPAIATDVGGTPEVIEQGETGLLVPPDDPATLARSASLLARDPDRRRRMAEAGRRQARARFTAARMARDVIEGYRSILNRSPAPQAPLQEAAR